MIVVPADENSGPTDVAAIATTWVPNVHRPFELSAPRITTSICDTLSYEYVGHFDTYTDVLISDSITQI